MSPSPGSRRVSVSPRPSENSSNTLRSSFSGQDRDAGEGSSRGTPRSSRNDPGHFSVAGIAKNNGEHGRTAPYLGADLAWNQDGGTPKRKKPRSSGGFLLNNAFSTRDDHDESPRSRRLSHEEHSPGSQGSKGKERASYQAKGNGWLGGNSGGNGRNGSLSMSGSHASSPSNGSRPSRDVPRDSLDYSINSDSPGAPEGRGSNQQHDSWHQPVQHPAAVDPTQIVQMALTLGETRRRQVSASQYGSPASAAGRRVTSAGLPGNFAGYGGGGSLKKYLNEQRRMQRNSSPSHGQNTAPPLRNTSIAYGPAGPFDVGIGQARLSISDGTVARVEKARTYIEARSQYMRLLSYVPPLKPDANAPGNTLVQTSSVPGGGVQMTRVRSYTNQKHPLGRQYDPLQVIRNRKLRARLRKPLFPDVDLWEDVDSIIDWVDAVEERASHPRYRGRDGIDLPSYLEDDEALQGERRASSGSHFRTDSNIGGKAKRARTDWYTSSAELLADLYWLEQNTNKSLVEDRHGNLLFPEFVRPGDEPSRQSQDRERKQNTPQDALTSVESIPASNIEDDISDDDSPERRQHGRRRLFHRNREQSPNALRQLWHKRKGRSPSTSGLSDSDEEIVGRSLGPRRRANTGEVNVGPLIRHMTNLMHTFNPTASTSVASPDTPEKWGKDEDDRQDRRDRMQPDHDTDFAQTAERMRKQVHPPHKQSPRKNQYPPLNTTFDSSMDGSSTPNSPAAVRLRDNLAGDGSPTNSRNSSLSRAHHRRKLPFLRTHVKDNSRLAPYEPDVDDESDARSSRHPSAETENTRPSLEAKDSSASEMLSPFRTNESDWSSAMGRKDNRDDKEPGSAVSRFFKHGRIGELVRGDKPDPHWKKDTIPEDVAQSSKSSNYESESDIDPHSANRTKSSSLLSRTGTNQSWASRALDRNVSSKPRYHVDNLPTFRPSNQTQSSFHNMADKARFNLRNPLRGDTSDLSRSTARSIVLNPNRIADRYERRESYGFPRSVSAHSTSRRQSVLASGRLAAVLDVPGEVGRGGLMVTGLNGVNPIRGSSSSPARRPTLDGTRHWSISDSNIHRHRSRSAGRPSARVVSKVDIERVRALLFCTGIKARVINHQAYEMRSPERADDFLKQVAKATGKQLVPVQVKHQHILAARMLVEDFDGSVDRIRDLADKFTGETTHSLAARLERLTRFAQDELMTQSRGLADEAERIVLEVTTKGTRDVQAVNEAAGGLVRARRRRMRWLRKMGWGMVEWMLLSVMWWVWLVVVCVRLVLKTCGAFGSTVRWLFFL